MSQYLESQLSNPHALTAHANRVKGLGQQAGATVEIAMIQLGDKTSFIAGINSGARWTKEQRALLRSWNVKVVPTNYKGKMTLSDGGALHAEENMAIYVAGIGARGLRWSRAVVGAHIDTKKGSRSYVCRNCRELVKMVGGAIEPPF
jgi:hypothetical protein